MKVLAWERWGRTLVRPCEWEGDSGIVWRSYAFSLGIAVGGGGEKGMVDVE